MPWPDLDQILDHAARLHALGISTVPTCSPTPTGRCSARWHEVPCKRRGKRPLVMGYRLRARHLLPLDAALSELRAFWPCNLAIVLPAGSRLVEADSPEAESEIHALGGGAVEVAPARERRPGRGRAFLFRDDPERRSKTSTGRGRSEAIDTLAPGSLFVCGLSVHATGHVNTWVPGRAPWETPIPFLPDALRALELDAGARTHAAPAGLVRPAASSVTTVPHRVAFLLSAYYGLRRLWEGEKTGGDASASGIDFSVARKLLKLGVPFAEVVRAIMTRPGAHRVDPDYASTTVNNAMAANARRRSR